MAYKAGVDRKQQMLFPETVDEYVSGDNPVRFIDAFVAKLDMSKLGFERAVPAREGTPGYDPRDLLKLFIYGYLNRMRSSRRLERETHRNVEVIWLVGRLRPDHKTIAEFRRKHVKALKQVSKEFVLLCRKLDLFSAQMVFVDGSKLRAVNSKDRNFTVPKLRVLLARIEANIEQYLAAVEAQDAQEKEQPGATDPGLQEKLKAFQERKQEYEGYLKHLQESGESQVSLTDADSRLMKSQGDMKVCFNAQIAVDAKHHLIVADDVTNEVNDERQLAPMAMAAKEALGVEALEVAADAGYHVGTQVVECEANGITPYAPKPKSSSKNQAAGLYTKEAFTYSAERDEYLCPAGQKLGLSTQTVVKGRKLSYYANWPACAGCPLRAQCTTSEQGRRIMRTPEEARLEAMADRLKERPELMLQRKSSVEHPFGTMKWTWDGYYFLMRGLNKVRGEFSLMTLAYNLRRVLSLLGVECLLEALRTGKMPVPQPI
ncbi:IS1182 family transposase [Longimicrobium sp.]|uniref:IS1182 family transposase n=1 Tax=Longimicrobium sp. TaxID=2029185 RepID=UPI003B3A280A